MLTVLFVLLMFVVFGKLAAVGLKMAWGLSRFLLTVVFLPVILIGLVLWGLIQIALPILIIVGIIAFVKMI